MSTVQTSCSAESHTGLGPWRLTSSDSSLDEGVHHGDHHRGRGQPLHL